MLSPSATSNTSSNAISLPFSLSSSSTSSRSPGWTRYCLLQVRTRVLCLDVFQRINGRFANFLRQIGAGAGRQDGDFPLVLSVDVKQRIEDFGFQFGVFLGVK